MVVVGVVAVVLGVRLSVIVVVGVVDVVVVLSVAFEGARVGGTPMVELDKLGL